MAGRGLKKVLRRRSSLKREELASASRLRAAMSKNGGRMGADVDIDSEDLFVDEDFPPGRAVLPGEAPFQTTWRRPRELCEEPLMFVDGAARFDVVQGDLGNCWAMAACAAMAERPELIARVVPQGQILHGPGYSGRVVLRLWHLGAWRDVEVDDRLPVVAGELLYAHCSTRKEFWVPLVEKAFAKFHGGYQNLSGGHLSEGFINLTGYSVKNIELEYYKTGKRKNELFHLLKTESANNSLIVCARGGEFQRGLPGYHGFSVTRVRHVRSARQRLLRLRNPWGDDEWTGKWRDDHEIWRELSVDVLEELDFKVHQDGEFWMKLVDFLKYFDEICIASRNPSIHVHKPLPATEEKIIRDMWKTWDGTVESPGVAVNPQILLDAVVDVTVPDPPPGDESPEDLVENEVDPKFENNNGNCTEDPTCVDAGVPVLIELLQDHNRRFRTDLLTIGFSLYKVRDDSARETIAAGRPLTQGQLVECCEPHASVMAAGPQSSVTSYCHLRPGEAYVVVPCTEGARAERCFLLRVFARNAHLHLRLLGEPGGVVTGHPAFAPSSASPSVAGVALASASPSLAAAREGRDPAFLPRHAHHLIRDAVNIIAGSSREQPKLPHDVVSGREPRRTPGSGSARHSADLTGTPHDTVGFSQQAVQTSQDAIYPSKEYLKKNATTVPYRPVRSTHDVINTPYKSFKTPQDAIDTSKPDIRTSQDADNTPDKSAKTQRDAGRISRESVRNSRDINISKQSVKIPRVSATAHMESIQTSGESVTQKQSIQTPRGSIIKHKQSIQGPRDSTTTHKESTQTPSDSNATHKQSIQAPSESITHKQSIQTPLEPVTKKQSNRTPRESVTLKQSIQNPRDSNITHKESSQIPQDAINIPINAVKISQDAINTSTRPVKASHGAVNKSNTVIKTPENSFNISTERVKTPQDDLNISNQAVTTYKDLNTIHKGATTTSDEIVSIPNNTNTLIENIVKNIVTNSEDENDMNSQESNKIPQDIVRKPQGVSTSWDGVGNPNDTAKTARSNARSPTNTSKSPRNTVRSLQDAAKTLEDAARIARGVARIPQDTARTARDVVTSSHITMPTPQDATKNPKDTHRGVMPTSVSAPGVVETTVNGSDKDNDDDNVSSITSI